MKFESPEYFYLLFLLPIIVFLEIVALKKRKEIILKYFSKNNLKKVVVKFKRSKIIMKLFIINIVFILIVFALAKPEYGYREINIAKKGQNIFIALDVSLSMRAQDVKPSRLELAKRKIIDFVNNLKGEAVSLVCFAGVPFVNIPLTTDYSIFNDYLSIIDTDLIPIQGTNFYNLVEKIIAIVKRKSLSSADVLIFSDGEDFSGNIKKALELCKKYKIKIFAIGLGNTKPVPIKLEDGSLKKDKNGNIVMTTLNEEFLKKICITTGGIYIKGVTSSKDIKIIHTYISDKNSFGKSKNKKREYINRYKWFVFPAFLLMCLYFLIDERKKIAVFLFFILCSNLNAANPSMLNKEGIKLYKKGKFNLAFKKFKKAYELDKNEKFLYNEALSLYKSKKFKESLNIFSNLINNNFLKEKSYYNRGVINYKLKKYKQALNDFKKALQLNPNDMQARINYELTLQKLKQNSQKNNNKNNNKKDKKNKSQNDRKSSSKSQKMEKKNHSKNKKQLEKLLNLYNEDKNILKKMIKNRLKNKKYFTDKDW